MIRTTPRSLLVATITSLAFLGAHAAHAQTAVTSCEQIVKGAAYLTGDLNCPPDTEAAVEIRSHGSLDMRGFSIHGGEYGVLCAAEEFIDQGLEVHPYTSCDVFGGGGTIDGQSAVGIVASGLNLRDVTIDMQDWIGLIIHRRLSFTNVTLHLGPNALGIMVGDKVPLKGTGLTMTGGGTGVAGAGIIKVDGLTATGYGRFSLLVKAAKLRNASLTGGTHGIEAGTVTLRDSTVTGHSDTGIAADRIKLTGSTVTGNGLDLSASRQPKLKSSTCETSNGWGVCTDD